MILDIFIAIITGIIVGVIIWYITKALSKKMIYKRLSKSMKSIQSNRTKLKEDVHKKLKNKLTKEFQISMDALSEDRRYEERSKDLDLKLNEIEAELNKIQHNSKVFKKYNDYSL